LQRDTFVEKDVPVNRLTDFVQPEVSPRAMVMSPCRPGGDYVISHGNDSFHYSYIICR
jgi:hypothetical protein